MNMKSITALASGWAVLGLSSFAAAAPIAQNSIWDVPHDASEYGHHIDWLINITNIFCAILFVVGCVWMGIAFVKHGRNHKAEHDHGDAKKQMKHALVLSAAIFIVVDGTLWVDSTLDVNQIFWNFSAVNEKADVVRIEVQGRQWFWQARYPGPDGKFNTADDALADQDIRVPVGRPVLLQLASPDVIHTFALPNFRIKQDAMPGMINQMWFQAKETGEFEIVCVQHCGVNHYQMRGILSVLSEKDYERWVALKTKDSLAVWEDKDTEAHWGWDWKQEG